MWLLFLYSISIPGVDDQWRYTFFSPSHTQSNAQTPHTHLAHQLFPPMTITHCTQDLPYIHSILLLTIQQYNKHKLKKITHESKSIKQHKQTLSSPTCTTIQSHLLTFKIGETEEKGEEGVAESDLKKKLGYHIKLVQWIHLVSWFKTTDGQTSGCLFWVISSILMNTEIVPQTCKLQNRVGRSSGIGRDPRTDSRTQKAGKLGWGGGGGEG